MTRKRTPAGITEGAAAHYVDPLYYDRIYRRRRHDVAYYAGEAERRGGPVLELGCGSGRVTLSIAKAGVDVVGVDPLPHMLKHAQAKLQRLPAATRRLARFVKGDMRKVRLDQRFALVIAPFNVFMHLYTRQDLERALATVRQHLRSRGRFIFDVAMPDFRALLRDPHRLFRCPDLHDPVDGRRYRNMETFDYDAAHQVQRTSMLFENMDDEADLQVRPLTQRLFYPAELEALLHYNGFVVESHTGDFCGHGLARDDESQVVVARLSKRPPR